MFYLLDDLGGVFLLIEIIVFVVIFVKLSNLRKDVEFVRGKGHKKEVKEAEKRVGAIGPQYREKTEHHPKKEKKAEPGVIDDFVKWVKEDFMMKLGAFLIILAVAWFVRYSFLNDWIGPVGRIALGMVAGTGVLAGGYFTIKKRPVPGQVLVVLGTTTLLLTTFAARAYYDFFTPGSALAIMSFVVLLTAVISVVHRSLALSVIALIGGAAAPLMTGGDTDSSLVLTTYILLLCSGVFGVVALRGWRSLTVLALLVTAFYVGPIEMMRTLDDLATWTFLALFYILFFVGSSAAIMHSKKIFLSDLVTTLITVLFAIWWTGEFIPDGWQSIVLAGTAIASMVVSLMLKSGGLPIKSTYLHGAATIVLLGAATVFEFDGEMLTIVFSLEALAFVGMAVYLLKDRAAAVATSALHIIPGALAMESVSHSWNSSLGLLNQDSAVLLIVMISFACTAMVLQRLPKKKEVLIPTVVHVIASTFFLFAIIWRGLEVFMTDDYAHGTALVIYTIVGLVLFFKGVVKHVKGLKWAGIVLLGLVLLRLLLVEIWAMSLVERIITFVVIGVMFIATAFFEKKSK